MEYRLSDAVNDLVTWSPNECEGCRYCNRGECQRNSCTFEDEQE